MLIKNAEFKELRTRLLKEAAGFYDELKELLEGHTDAKSRQALAAAYFQLAELTDKIGDKKAALAVHRQALALRRELAAAGADVEARLDVARSLLAVGELLRSAADPAEALSAFQEERDLAAALEAESPTDAVRVQLALGHRGVANVFHDRGKPAESLDSLRKALAIYQKLPEAGQYLVPGGGPTFGLQLQAVAYMSIGFELRKTGKAAEGQEFFRKAVDIMQKVADANPDNASVQADLANIHGNIAFALETTGKPDEAMVSNRKALAILQRVADANPAVTGFKFDLGVFYHNIAYGLSRMGKAEEAIESYRKALPIRQKLVDANPTIPEYQENLAWNHIALGQLLARQKRFAEAFTAIDAGLGILQKLVEKDAGYASGLANSHAYRGGALVRFGQPSKAVADLRRAVELWGKAKPTDSHSRFEWSRALALLTGLGGEEKSGVTAGEAAKFADQAIAALRDAFSAGFGWPNELEDPDFDALRGREDFKKLVAEVEAKAGPRAKL
jgi:tetratricopeptide (TPR) repeat protein